MLNLSNDALKQLQEAICRPEGTIEFTYVAENLFKSNCLHEVILEVIAGNHYFKIEKNNMNLIFYHFSPGTDTRVAVIDLVKVKRAPIIYICFTWTPQEINAYVGPYKVGGEIIKAVGKISSIKYRITKNGDIVQLGDMGVEVSYYSFFVGGKPMLKPTAFDTWKNTIEAIKVLQKGSSDDGYIFETIISNLSIVTLVTGFEVYCKTRFIELEKEGIKPNIEALVTSCFSREEIEKQIPENLKNKASKENKSFLEIIADEKINFQNYKENKKAYRKAYNIKFSEIGIKSEELSFLQQIIRFRHRIIHVSPFISMLNQPEVSPEEPIFSSKELVRKAMECFDKFINNLHQTTLI
ncbi:hypothetical protein [Marinitoga sp. 38H-ov]|uniref:hypothetical protein n=1 Tax=Marinitoga sp. 38H-ov TaxID=1755814 RepID=UPI0016A01190|nr:hypothetical protein [Marinitoga sp. 38H-ov]KAF2956231.1 hypothetical protein AS160_06780 [Marinitoga sp. 38H-ov]